MISTRAGDGVPFLQANGDSALRYGDKQQQQSCSRYKQGARVPSAAVLQMIDLILGPVSPVFEASQLGWRGLTPGKFKRVSVRLQASSRIERMGSSLILASSKTARSCQTVISASHCCHVCGWGTPVMRSHRERGEAAGCAVAGEGGCAEDAMGNEVCRKRVASRKIFHANRAKVAVYMAA